MAGIRYRLHDLLHQYHLTAKQLAEATGIRENTLSAMRRGTLREIPKEMLDLLTGYFRALDPNFEPGDLFEYKPEADEPPVVWEKNNPKQRGHK